MITDTEVRRIFSFERNHHQLAFVLAVEEISCCSMSFPASGGISFPDFGHSKSCVVVSLF